MLQYDGAAVKFGCVCSYFVHLSSPRLRETGKLAFQPSSGAPADYTILLRRVYSRRKLLKLKTFHILVQVITKYGSIGQ